jgi:hypothetical protein
MFIFIVQTLQKKWNEICMKQLTGGKHMQNDCFPRTLKFEIELLMQNKHYLEVVDRFLQDIPDTSHDFGGMSIVFGGNFCQILLVDQEPKLLYLSFILLTYGPTSKFKHSLKGNPLHIDTN